MPDSEKEKRESGGKRWQIEGLPILNPRVAACDVASEEHWVCAPTMDGTAREIASFGATTPELIRMREWLKERKVKSLAMESTGVYWIAPYEVMEAGGIEPLLIDNRQLARVPGRDNKSDLTDCEWMQRLHSCGLLKGAFRPKEEICMLRTLVRDRANLIAETGDWLRRMQKSLDQMNVRVHRAVSDLDGATGMAILRAIVKGEKDPRKLAQLRDRRCHKSEKEIAEQLSGHWREDHLFSLSQALKMYDALQERMVEYDQEIMRRLASMERPECQGKEAPPVGNREKAKQIERRGEEPMRQALYRMSGVDLTSINALGVESVQLVVSEYGPDLSRFPSEHEFVSHVTLSPHRPTSGGKPVKKRKKGSASSRVAAGLRMAALSQRHSDTALGAYYRHVARRKSADVAVFATARKLATFIYRLLRWGKPYVDEGAEAYEKRHQQARVNHLNAEARDLGYQLTPIPSQA
jgi:transposase